MRQLFFYFFLIFILGLRSLAENVILPDPMTCGLSFKDMIELKHKGNTPASNHVSYFMKLSFAQPGQFSYASNWGMNIKQETVDGASLQFSRSAEGLQKAISSNEKNMDCKSSDKIEACALSAYDVLDKLNTAYTQLISSSEKKEQQAALLCAKSITLSYVDSAYKFKDLNELGVAHIGKFKLEILDSEQISVVMSRLQALNSKREAAKAKKIAELNNTLNGKSNNSSGVKRQAGKANQ